MSTPRPNPIKRHESFAASAVLPGENPEEFDLLVTVLRDRLAPVGFLEEALVFHDCRIFVAEAPAWHFSRCRERSSQIWRLFRRGRYRDRCHADLRAKVQRIEDYA